MLLRRAKNVKLREPKTAVAFFSTWMVLVASLCCHFLLFYSIQGDEGVGKNMSHYNGKKLSRNGKRVSVTFSIIASLCCHLYATQYMKLVLHNSSNMTSFFISFF